jgi:hypothetical protein
MVETLSGEAMCGSRILYYDLGWDMGSGGVSWESYSLMTADDGASTITTNINGLESGQEYQFMYRAENIHGWSVSYSQPVTIKTLSEPDTIGVPETSNSGS